MPGFSGLPNCIASDAVPLWECPCRECTKLEWQQRRQWEDDEPETRTLSQYRRDEFPSTYPAPLAVGDTGYLSTS